MLPRLTVVLSVVGSNLVLYWFHDFLVILPVGAGCVSAVRMILILVVLVVTVAPVVAGVPLAAVVVLLAVLHVDAEFVTAVSVKKHVSPN